MSINCLIFTTRRSDLTREQFQDHYDNRHFPLTDKLFAECKPDENVRYYIDRSESGNQKWFLGGPEDFEYDCCTRLTWHSQESWDAALQKMADPEVAKALAEDEERFLDRSQTKLVFIGAGHGRGA